MERQCLRIRLITITAVAAAALAAGVGAAAAQPNPNASCVAQLGAHGEMGNPGEYQRTAHDPTFGQRSVKFVAMLDDCTDPDE